MTTEREALAGLYPFLSGGKRSDSRGREALLESISLKAADSAEVKRRFFSDHAADVLVAAERIAAAYRNGGRLLVMGNGGSSCDAQHVAVEFIHPATAGRPAMAAINLAAETSVMSAISNDVGFDRVFARQVEALGAKNDVLFGVSTSGESANLIAAYRVARSMGMSTIGLAGGDGGAMARSSDLDVCLTVPSQSIHRVQECHVAIYHILWDLVHTLLADDRIDMRGGR